MSTAMPKVLSGMEALRRDNPWPELPGSVEPFYLSLDGGGRHLVTDLIRERDVKLMVEVGCFLCGSTRQWFEASPDLEVIGVDPWDANWAPYVRKMAATGDRQLGDLPDPLAIADTIQEHGNYVLALNNVRDHRDRFTPLRRRSPEALHYLAKRAIRPDLIYVDAFKTDEDLWVAHDLFPNAILCGDDWTWRDEDGHYLMRDHVEHFVAEKGYQVHAEGATWVVLAPPLPWDWDATSATTLVRGLDRHARKLLLYVASASAAGASPTFGDALRDLRRSPAEVLRAAKAVNDSPAAVNREQVLGLAEDGTDEGALDGRAFLIPAVLVTHLPIA